MVRASPDVFNALGSKKALGREGLASRPSTSVFTARSAPSATTGREGEGDEATVDEGIETLARLADRADADKVRDGGHRLVVERVVRGDKNRYLGGLVASMNEDGGEWLVEAAHLGGRPVRASDFLDSIAELRGLTLVAKEVSERLTVVH